MRIFYFISFLVLLNGCGNSQKKHMQTVEACDGVYIEIYRSFGGGALSSDILSEYLTDSLKFRVYVGDFDDFNQYFKYRCDSNYIYIEKVEKNLEGKIEVIESKVLDLDSLSILRSRVSCIKPFKAESG